jgi:two-component system NtrC family response regulator
MTGDGDPEGAELAMKSQVWDYIQKGNSNKEFKSSLLRALEYRQQKKSKIDSRKIKRESIIGQSQKTQTCLEKVLQASNNDTHVLITGETGTGKELFAKAIHENSKRRENGFIVVDCGALPEHLVESVLFGHSRGAFTGADTDKVGLIQLADRGTLFLDEVGELPLDIQKKFLRVIQEKRFRPVGGKKEIEVDFRLVSATHRDVLDMVQRKRFREDFYFRIASIRIEIPPLRNRKEDIPLLAAYHMERKIGYYNDVLHEMSQAFLDDLNGYNWPGNIRELFNAIDSSCSDAYQETILFPKHLPDNIRAFNIKNKIKQKTDTLFSGTISKKKIEDIPSLKDHIDRAKYEYIQDLIALTQGNAKELCRISGLSRGHLYRLLKQYDIKLV